MENKIEKKTQNNIILYWIRKQAIIYLYINYIYMYVYLSHLEYIYIHIYEKEQTKRNILNIEK